MDDRAREREAIVLKDAVLKSLDRLERQEAALWAAIESLEALLSGMMQEIQVLRERGAWSPTDGQADDTKAGCASEILDTDVESQIDEHGFVP